MTAPTITLSGVVEDLKLTALETPADEWVATVEWLIGRDLSVRERWQTVHYLTGYKSWPSSRLWADGVRSLARLLVAGGMAA